MTKAYRIYLGARNTPNRTFSPKDVTTLEKILAKYFKGFTTVQGIGSWEGQTEETRIITVTTSPEARGPLAGDDPVHSVMKELKNAFRQQAVMLEEGGFVSLL